MEEKAVQVSHADAFRFDGKQALVVGGATGMGAATAEVVGDLGAEVTVMDVAAVEADGVRSVTVNLAERESIDAALGSCPDRVDALFCCAGVADGTPGIERINFIGHRYLIDRLLERGALGTGSAIGMISSAAGLGWESQYELLTGLLDATEWDDAVTWVAEHGKADYMSMKQAMCAYVARQAMPLLARGIRINAICPGPTDTPLAQANKETWLGFGADWRGEVGVEASTPLEQAFSLVYLCSAAAGAINGQTIISDQGYFASGLTDAFPSARPVAEFLMGRLG